MTFIETIQYIHYDYFKKDKIILTRSVTPAKTNKPKAKL